MEKLGNFIVLVMRLRDYKERKKMVTQENLIKVWKIKEKPCREAY